MRRLHIPKNAITYPLPEKALTSKSSPIISISAKDNNAPAPGVTAYPTEEKGIVLILDNVNKSLTELSGSQVRHPARSVCFGSRQYYIAPC